MSDQTSQAATPSPAPPAIQPTNSLAVAALVLGVLSLLMFWIPFLGWIPVIVGLVLGLVALQQPYGRGLAIGGLVCSGIALGLKLLFWVFIIGAFHAFHVMHHHYW